MMGGPTACILLRLGDWAAGCGPLVLRDLVADRPLVADLLCRIEGKVENLGGGQALCVELGGMLRALTAAGMHP